MPAKLLPRTRPVSCSSSTVCPSRRAQDLRALPRAAAQAQLVRLLEAPRSGGPAAVLAYLSRYTHRVAIANRRLIAIDQNGVTFSYKDYRGDGRARYKVMTLATSEFIRRFLIHVLPKGFHRIRYYGLLAKSSCAENLARARHLLAVLKPQDKPANSAATDQARSEEHTSE